MSKKNIEFGSKIYVLIQIIVCVITYTIIYKFIGWQVENNFRYIMAENNVMRTLRNYRSTIGTCIAIAVLFTAIWWLWAWVKIEFMRCFYERNTFIIAIVFCIVLFAVISMIGVKNGVVMDGLGNPYPLYYAYAVWSAFVFNMYLLPPDTVKNVISFGQRAGRAIVSVMMLLCTIFILFKGEGL